MHLKSFIHTFAALTLLGAPTAALAQGDQNGGTWQQNHQWNQTTQNGQHRDRDRDRDDRDRNGRANQEERRREEERRERERDRNRGYNGGYYPGGYNNGAAYPGGYNNGTYNGGYGGYNNGVGRNGELDGIVSQFSSFNLDLSRGPHVHLHQGTVINPTGTTLSPGMRVAIYGHPNSDGTFEADQINVVGNGAYGTNSSGNNPYGRWGNILGRFGL